MSKRIRLAKYTRKVCACVECPCYHNQFNEGTGWCLAGKQAVHVSIYTSLGLPKNCPLEDYE